eukprot:6206118-Pleurochrysis_carterae.AAC.2
MLVTIIHSALKHAISHADTCCAIFTLLDGVVAPIPLALFLIVYPVNESRTMKLSVEPSPEVTHASSFLVAR